MNQIDTQLRDAARQEARATRVAMYADWLAHDVDGLTFNLSHPFEHSTAILAEARELVAAALVKIDAAIERDKQAHQEEK